MEISIEAMVRKAALLLPVQFPLHAFVTQNTLHAFEHLPFCEASVQAAKLYGSECFLSEKRFAEHISSGRITAGDIEAVLRDLEIDDQQLVVGNFTEKKFKAKRTQHLFEIPKSQSLGWLLRETTVLSVAHPLAPPHQWDNKSLNDLWLLFSVNASAAPVPLLYERPRDHILAQYEVDTDDLTRPFLIKLCASFFDQGIAYWTMPYRDQGLLAAFRLIYSQKLPPPSIWMNGMHEILAQQQKQALSPQDTIEWALSKLKVPQSLWGQVIAKTLVSMRGWAGMVNQLELRPDRAPVHHPHASLIEYLAVQLLLEVFAVDFVHKNYKKKKCHDMHKSLASQNLVLAYEAFISAQCVGLSITDFKDEKTVERFLLLVAQFNEVERRQILHLAFEYHYRMAVFDSLQAHHRKSSLRQKITPHYQTVFCMDDREESMRRHLEEINPQVETFGYAGFFGVAMYYQGVEDIRPRALCPIVVVPKHIIFEKAIDCVDKIKHSKRKRVYGEIIRRASIASRTMLRGSILTAFVGSAAILPLIARCLFPSLTRKWLATHSKIVYPQPLTRLQLERQESSLGDLYVGYTVAEMVNIVKNVLGAMGVKDYFSPLFIFLGHGSSSLNNPHRAAYNCGACGGNAGGPNARAFAAMANLAQVREQLKEHNLFIPDTTWFLGALHNTCEDSITYFDEDLVPSSLLGQLAQAKEELLMACESNAHERVRRFEESNKNTTSKQAHAIARHHSFDLAQPRPEYGHNTNALCVVGRRDSTKWLFLDRRCFLISYDSGQDEDGTKLNALLSAACPVGLGINLEYYFSHIDPLAYGSGTKLPHNIVGLIGVMDGPSSDLRTGLPWQAVEIHEPVRLLMIIEAQKDKLLHFLTLNATVRNLVDNAWIHLAVLEPEQKSLWLYQKGDFVLHTAQRDDFKEYASSCEHYHGQIEHLEIAHITPPASKGAAYV